VGLNFQGFQCWTLRHFLSAQTHWHEDLVYKPASYLEKKTIIVVITTIPHWNHYYDVIQFMCHLWHHWMTQWLQLITAGKNSLKLKKYQLKGQELHPSLLVTLCIRKSLRTTLAPTAPTSLRPSTWAERKKSRRWFHHLIQPTSYKPEVCWTGGSLGLHEERTLARWLAVWANLKPVSDDHNNSL